MLVVVSVGVIVGVDVGVSVGVRVGVFVNVADGVGLNRGRRKHHAWCGLTDGWW